MVKLIIPAAGKSTRFTGKPKWLLTHPRNGNILLNECFQELEFHQLDGIYITLLGEQLQKYCGIINPAYLPLQMLFPKHYDQIKFLVLDTPTNSQPETVLKTIEHFGITGPIFIKDCDNSFKTTIPDSVNGVCYLQVTPNNENSVSNFCGKSYLVQPNKKRKISDTHIAEIIEKTISSDLISVGGYSFEDATYFSSITNQMILENKNEFYVSHVIDRMIQSGKDFHGIQVTDYQDWGTQDAWNKYCKNFITLFLDLDGCTVKESSKYLPPLWGESDPLTKNVERIKELRAKGAYIVLTTARDEWHRPKTIEQMNRIGIEFDQLVMGLPHGRRIIINDYSDRNPYPSCVAINLASDTENLAKLL